MTSAATTVRPPTCPVCGQLMFKAEPSEPGGAGEELVCLDIDCLAFGINRAWRPAAAPDHGRYDDDPPG